MHHCIPYQIVHPYPSLHLLIPSHLSSSPTSPPLPTLLPLPFSVIFLWPSIPFSIFYPTLRRPISLPLTLIRSNTPIFISSSVTYVFPSNSHARPIPSASNTHTINLLILYFKQFVAHVKDAPALHLPQYGNNKPKPESGRISGSSPLANTSSQ